MIYKISNLKLIYSGNNKNIFFDGIYYNITLIFKENIEFLSVKSDFIDDFQFYYINDLIFEKILILEEKYIHKVNKTHIILYLDKKLDIKKLKIITKSNFKFKIYGHKYNKYFFSALTGGFGDRVISMMNAIYLAKHTNSGFGFYWGVGNNSFLKIENEEYMFSNKFINKYSYSNHLNILNKSNMRCLDIINSFSELTNKPFEYYYGYYTNHYHFIKPKLFYKECDEIFKQIDFSDHIKDIISIARKIFIQNFTKNTIAIHLRRGDIINDEYRFYHYIFIDKSIPNEVVLEIIENNKYNDILLFGEDKNDIENVMEYFKNSSINIRSCKEFIPECITNDTDLAIFEIIFMSECIEIYSNSGFARLASLIKNKKEPILWLKHFDTIEICNIIEKNFNKINSSKLQLAYSLFCLFRLSMQLKRNNQHIIDILNKSIMYDDNNILLKLFLAKYLIIERRYEQANNVIQECYSDKFFITAIESWKNELLIYPIDFNINKYTFLFYYISLIYSKIDDLSKMSYLYINFICNNQELFLEENVNFDFKNFKNAYDMFNQIKNDKYYKIGNLLIYKTSKTYDFIFSFLKIPFYFIFSKSKMVNIDEIIEKRYDKKEYYIFKIATLFCILLKKFYKINIIKILKDIKRLKKECKIKYAE